MLRLFLNDQFLETEELAESTVVAAITMPRMTKLVWYSQNHVNATAHVEPCQSARKTARSHSIQIAKTANRTTMFTRSKTDQKSVKILATPTAFILL